MCLGCRVIVVYHLEGGDGFVCQYLVACLREGGGSTLEGTKGSLAMVIGDLGLRKVWRYSRFL